jgi:putative FmdB family regulatory protein
VNVRGGFLYFGPMPIYEYRCEDGHTFEVMQRMTDDPVTVCETCGKPVQRVFHPIAVHFKGSGFYNTDYGTRNRAREQRESKDSSATASKESSSTDSGAKSGGETKSSDSPAKSADSAGKSSSDGSAKKADRAPKPAGTA